MRSAASARLEFRILANKPRSTTQLFDRADAEPEADEDRDSQGEAAGLVGARAVRGARAGHSLQRRGRSRSRARKNGKDDRSTEVLVINDDYNVTGDYLTSEIGRLRSERRAHRRFRFQQQGGGPVRRLYRANLPEKASFTRKLGIILDGQVVLGPRRHRSRISDRGQITGMTNKKRWTPPWPCSRRAACRRLEQKALQRSPRRSHPRPGHHPAAAHAP